MITFKLQDLGMAYRKVKADLYDSSHPRLTDIASYAEKPHAYLIALLAKINSDDGVSRFINLDGALLAVIYAIGGRAGSRTGVSKAPASR